MHHNPFAWLNRVIEGGQPRHEMIPNDSASMIHLEDLANLFLAAYENPNATGRYFGVFDSLHWQDIYAECQKLLPNMTVAKPTIMTAVPRFYQSLYNKISLNFSKQKGFKKRTHSLSQSDSFFKDGMLKSFFHSSDEAFLNFSESPFMCIFVKTKCIAIVPIVC